MNVKRDADLSKYYVDVENWILNKDVKGESKHEHLTLSYRKAAVSWRRVIVIF